MDPGHPSQRSLFRRAMLANVAFAFPCVPRIHSESLYSVDQTRVPKPSVHHRRHFGRTIMREASISTDSRSVGGAFWLEDVSNCKTFLNAQFR